MPYYKYRHGVHLMGAILALLLAGIWGQTAQATPSDAARPHAAAPHTIEDVSEVPVTAPANGILSETPDDYAFVLWRNGKKIGTHTIEFSRQGDRLNVAINIDLVVKLGPIPVYKYAHTNNESWQNGRLMSIATSTNDNGDKFAVVGAAQGADFVLDTQDGPLVLPGDVIPTSYWVKDTINRRQLLNTQEGGLIDISIVPIGLDETRQAMKYVMSGDLEMDMWYVNDRLFSLAFDGGGALIEYRLTDPDSDKES